MRCAYPLGLSVLRWPHTVLERREAVVVLADISPMAASQVVHALPGQKEEKGLPSGRKPDPEGPNNSAPPNSNKKVAQTGPVTATPPSANRTTSTNPAAAAAGSNAKGAPTGTPRGANTTTAATSEGDESIVPVGTPVPDRTRFQAAGGPNTGTQPVAIPTKR
jgi:hypothetical protein